MISLWKNIAGQPCIKFNRFYLLLLFEAVNYFFERKFGRKFEEESLKVAKVTKKNLFNGKFYKDIKKVYVVLWKVWNKTKG